LEKKVMQLVEKKGKSSGGKDRLIQFYGDECVHCHEMNTLVERLENELRLSVTRLEVWHNDENAKLLEGFDQGRCGGIPFFFNEKSGKWLCGSVPYDKLKAWATEK
jgi:thiol-disulfide isomerase/thioredoxin